MRTRTLWTTVGVAAAIVAVTAAVAVPLLGGATSSSSASVPAPTSSPTASAVPAVPHVSSAALAALPEAQYSAVVAGLMPFDRTVTAATVFHLRADAPLFGAARTAPVARFAASDFLRQPTTVVGLRREGDWELVLTPARQQLPSTSHGAGAAAQTSAWVPVASLQEVTTPTSRVVISTKDQTVSIVDGSGAVTHRFDAGVGTADTPTPTGVTGYLEQRYVDPAQGTGDHPIQLTSLHSSAADEPYGGHDGGLIGLHWNATTSGAVSHGCVRLDAEAVAAVNALPLGTLVTVE
ncbi:L,D-transpeptidase-like protein [Curtobacterium flaccumfaciens]|uniref:L,D-transpeptidase-like protein n=1 Tax=Curtobacterium flaccumfaciens TaxID=2035 RepID=A0A4R6DBA1_9MICO|nr:L,D-transpeptidase [Curtobacterium flaccumfaciens]TDN41735.1 L,D-transpeptidase-like protein [Curtobacterium flaccumfaciens]